MSRSSVASHVVERFQAAAVDADPFPHFFVDEVFPEDYYRELLDRLPDPSRYQKLADVSDLDQDYFEHRDQATLTREWIAELPAPELRRFWDDTARWLLGPELRAAAVDLFAPYLGERFPGGLPELTTEAELIRHRARYCLEPHTDLQSKVVVVLFYLPARGDLERLGTSIYRPKDPGFTCPGGALHPFEGFELVKTVPFRPRSAFGFLKSDRSFHGVEPISEEDGRKTSRDVIEWVVYDKVHDAALKAA